MPLGLLGIILAISGPSMLIAWLKLRQRNIGPILEANGWAINGRVKINIPLGTSLTATKKLPLGAKRLLDDPFEDQVAKRRFRLTVAALALLVLIGLAGWLAWRSHDRHGTYDFWNTLGRDTPAEVHAKELSLKAKELSLKAKELATIAAQPEATAEQKKTAADAQAAADAAVKALEPAVEPPAK
jgi:hypothetical protein